MLRRCWLLLTVVLLGFALPCAAQQPPAATSQGSPQPTSAQEMDVAAVRMQEMMFYERERERYEDPKTAIRRRAELKAQQRAERLASQKWFGISNSRPTVSCTPAAGGSYAPYWGSNTYDPNRWRPYQPLVVRPGYYR